VYVFELVKPKKKNAKKSVFSFSRKEDCLACSQMPRTLEVENGEVKLQALIAKLQDDPSFQMRSPGLTTFVNGKNRTLYMSTVSSIEERTRENLKKTLNELGVCDGHELYVADVTTPNTLTVRIKFIDVEMKEV